jgi:CHAT domain-containing protein/Tfp pilus assembly protein PilF
VAEILNNLAVVYSSQGKYVEAEGFYRRALVIREKALGPDHAVLANPLIGLANVYGSQGKYGEAEGLFRRALAIREKTLGPDHPDVAQILNSLAIVDSEQGKYGEAEGLYGRVLAIRERALGPDHPDVAQTLNNVAAVYGSQGRYGEAEGLFRRALAIKEKTLGPDHPDVAEILINLANLYHGQGKYGEAEGLHRRALEIQEKVLGTDHPVLAVTLNNLANVYGSQGKYGEAEGLFRRALAIKEKALGPDHPNVADTLHNLANVLRKSRQGWRSRAALPARARDRDKGARPGPPRRGPHPQQLGDLVQLPKQVRRGRGAHPACARHQGKGARPADHPDVAEILNNLAAVYGFQGRYGEAEGLYRRALAIREKALGADHPDVATTLNNLANVYASAGDSARALAYSRKATHAVVAHAATETLGTKQKEKSGGLVEQRVDFFRLHVANLAAAAQKDIEPTSQLGREGLEIAQWATQSSAASALQQMGARFASGSGSLAARVRERQDLAALWREQDKKLVDALGKPQGQQDQAALERLRTQMADTENRIAAATARLEKEFPEYASLANPKPLQSEGVQAQLGTGEALVLFLDLDLPAFTPAPEQTFVWVVTKTDVRWVRINLGTKALSERVQRLRAGLDRNAAARAAVQIGEASPAARGFLPFDLAVAHELYSALFGPIEDLIKNKQLLIVASGPLTSLPFHVLVTEKPEQGVPDTIEGYAGAAWLAKRNAITVLPSVASLAALRQHARGSRAPEPYLGFGNPLLVGGSGTDRRPWSVQTCGSTNKRIEVAALAAPEQRGVSEFFRGGAANVAAVRSLAPLPETAEELCEVGHRLGAGDKDIMLGEAATETTVKAMSADGRLARARVVHFATHGLIAGEMKGLAEPALVLTPPADGAEASALQRDDGLLTASEVAELKLNADWVVLSACNTAAGDGNAEALSGLARAFFYAGARALLVSHWPVNSGAAVKLTTRAFTALEQHPDIGRAEALRRAMLATIAEGGQQSHPSYWAPFVVVGEGVRQ